MKVIIFGVSGNCGKYSANRFLSKGWEVVGVSRSNFNIENSDYVHIQGDIRDDNLYVKLPTDVDLVLNFAGVQPSIMKTSENTDLAATLKSYIDVNVNGVFKVLEFVRCSKIPAYIYSTSHRDIENYWSKDAFLKNDLPPNINYEGDHSMYAVSKTSAKMIGDYYSKAFGIRVFNLRLPMIFLVPEEPYYLRDGKPVVMPFLQIIKNAVLGKELEIWGDPKMPRDYVHIQNLFSLVELCYESTLDGGTFNVGTGEAVATEKFIKSIGQKFAKYPDKVSYIYKPEKKVYKCAIYDVSEQKEVLGYKPIMLNEMLDNIKADLEEGNCFNKWGWS